MTRGRTNRANGHGVDFEEDAPRSAGDGDAPGAGHNSEARSKALAEGLSEWCALQDKEDDLLEKYIEPVRKLKAEIKSKLKADHEIPTVAFNARAALRRIELRKDADEVVLAVNEMFKATPVGANLDLVALAERVEKKRAEKEAKKTQATSTEAAL